MTADEIAAVVSAQDGFVVMAFPEEQKIGSLCPGFSTVYGSKSVVPVRVIGLSSRQEWHRQANLLRSLTGEITLTETEGREWFYCVEAAD